MEAPNNSSWPLTDMEFEPQMAISNHSNPVYNSAEIMDPWSYNSQASDTHPAQSLDMEPASPYVAFSSSIAHYHTESPYPYPHFPTNPVDDYPYDTQDAPAQPQTAFSHHHQRTVPLLPPEIPSTLPHTTNGSHRVGLSEPWSLQGIRDMEAFEQVCSNTNLLLRMKPRGQRRNALASSGMIPSPPAPNESSSNNQSSPKVGKAGCLMDSDPSHVAILTTPENRSEDDMVKSEYTNHDPFVPYISSNEPSAAQSTNDFSSLMNYPSAPAPQDDFSSPSTNTISSSLSDSVPFSPVTTTSPMSPPLPPPVTVPSQTPALNSPVSSRPTLRHLNILPAPLKRPVPIDLDDRQKRNVSSRRTYILGNSLDTSSTQEAYQTGAKSTPSNLKNGKSIQNGPVLGSPQTRNASHKGATESSKPSGSARSRRNVPAHHHVTTSPDRPSSPEHKLTETNSIPAADLDSFFQPTEQGCIGGRKAWVCPQCKKFVRKQDRASHKLGHEGKKRYDCRCGKQFGRPQDADRHIREQAPCGRCQGKLGRYGKDGYCSNCVTEIEQGCD